LKGKKEKGASLEGKKGSPPKGERKGEDFLDGRGRGSQSVFCWKRYSFKKKEGSFLDKEMF